MAPITNKILISEMESRICKIDGIEFPSSKKMIWHVRKKYGLSYEQYIIQCYYGGNRPTCLSTGKELSFKANKTGPWFTDYSKNNFPRKKHSKTTKQKIKDGVKKSINEKYGVDNVFETEWCKERIKKTNLKKYGVENPMCNKEISSKIDYSKSKETIEKTKQTNIKRYGATTYTSTDECKHKMRYNQFLRIYGSWDSYTSMLVENNITCLGNKDDIKNGNPIKYKCLLDTVEWDENILLRPICPVCLKNGQLSARSKMEAQMKSFLDANNVSYTQNKRYNTTNGIYELDFLINGNIGVEMNGNYYHSECSGRKDKNYHIKKTEAFEEIGIQVIHIFEDEWENKTDIVKDKILSKINRESFIKVDSRKCIVKETINSECKSFLQTNHIQGHVNASISLAMFYGDDMVSVMTFSGYRPSLGSKKEDGCYEMIRYSSLLNHTVRGGFTKMLSYFIKKYSPEKIISYGDKRFSNNKTSVYNKCGFQYIGNTKPNYWYCKKLDRKHRFNFTKKKLIKQGFDKNLSEWEIMKSRGFDRIWDCGSLKYEWTKKEGGKTPPS